MSIGLTVAAQRGIYTRFPNLELRYDFESTGIIEPAHGCVKHNINAYTKSVLLVISTYAMVRQEGTAHRQQERKDAMTQPSAERPTMLANLWKFRQELFAATRPLTMVYGFCWTIVGYRIILPIPWTVALLNAVIVALITGTIMMYNDHIDRHRDKEDGKPFASKHPDEIKLCWKLLSGLIVILMFWLATINTRAALFSALVWVSGTLYSWVPHWFVVQNLIVAACSASPVLCGSVAMGQWNEWCLSTSAILFSLITMSEIIKDFEDMQFDVGYKATIPLHSTLIAVRTVTAIISFTLPLVWYTFGWKASIMLAIPLCWINGDLSVLFAQGRTLPNPDVIQHANRVVDATILLFSLMAIMA